MWNFAGDGYLLTFPNVLSAARWAVALQMNHANDPIATPNGPLKVRIGLHVGTPLTDPRFPNDFIGQEVDFAARLMALANGGQIVLSDLAAAHLKHAHASDSWAHAHGDCDLKGIGKVPVYELLYTGKSAGPLSQAALAPNDLPPPPHRLTGRDDWLAELRERLFAGGIVTLKAEGGMGKTTLALACAWRMLSAGELPGGVAWINCELAPKTADCLRWAAEVFLGDRFESERPPAVQKHLAEHLAKRAGLIVLDNFETVARDAEVVRWLAGLRSPFRVLVTTREVPAGLSGPVVVLPELQRADAVQLFSYLCAGHGRVASDADRATIDQLCSSVGDQPLAIELLAFRARALPLPRLLERLRKGVAVVAGEDPTRPSRHRSMRACFAMSYDQLSDRAKTLLLAVGPIPDGFCADLLTALAGDDWDEAAEELVGTSLWRLQGERWSLHPLIRQCVLEQLGERRVEAEKRFLAALTVLAGEQSRKLQPGEAPLAMQLASLEWFETERANLFAAIEMAIDTGDIPSAHRLIDAHNWFWGHRGYWRQAENLYGKAAEAARATGDRKALGRYSQGLGRAYRHLSKLPKAEAAYSAAIEQFGDAKSSQLAQTWSELSRVYAWQDRINEAEQAAVFATALFRERIAAGSTAGKISSLAATLCRLGIALRLQERWDEARAAQQESLDLARSIGETSAIAKAITYLGDLKLHAGDIDGAEANFREAMALNDAFGRREVGGDQRFRLGRCHAARVHWDSALDEYRIALELYRNVGKPFLEGRTRLHMAKVELGRGGSDKARLYLLEARVLLKDESPTWVQKKVETMLGIL